MKNRYSFGTNFAIENTIHKTRENAKVDGLAYYSLPVTQLKRVRGEWRYALSNSAFFTNTPSLWRHLSSSFIALLGYLFAACAISIEFQNIDYCFVITL